MGRKNVFNAPNIVSTKYNNSLFVVVRVTFSPEKREFQDVHIYIYIYSKFRAFAKVTGLVCAPVRPSRYHDLGIVPCLNWILFSKG